VLAAALCTSLGAVEAAGNGASHFSPAGLAVSRVPLLTGHGDAREPVDQPAAPLAGARAPRVTPLARQLVPPRPALLVPLYAGFVALQAADVITTFRALDQGAVEGNPVMGGVVRNRAAFVAMKAGMTVGTLWMSEKLWKKNRVAAVVMLSAFNIGYALVVAHNARVIARQ
jgi:hypothetical protein